MTPEAETPAQKRKRLEKRNRYRMSVCKGCRHNYYNWPKPTSERGDVAVADDYSCWFLHRIMRGKCPQHSENWRQDDG